MPEKPEPLVFISNTERRRRSKRQRVADQKRRMIEAMPDGMRQQALAELERKEAERKEKEGGAGAGGG